MVEYIDLRNIRSGSYNEFSYNTNYTLNMKMHIYNKLYQDFYNVLEDKIKNGSLTFDLINKLIDKVENLESAENRFTKCMQSYQIQCERSKQRNM